MAVMAGLKGSELDVRVGFFDDTAAKQDISLTADAEEEGVVALTGLTGGALGDVYFFESGKTTDYLTIDTDGAAMASNANPISRIQAGAQYTGTAAKIDLMGLCATSNSIEEASADWEEESTSCSIGGYPYSYRTLTAGEITVGTKTDNCDPLQMRLYEAFKTGEDFVLQYYDKKCKMFITFIVALGAQPVTIDDMSGNYSTEYTFKPKAWSVRVTE